MTTNNELTYREIQEVRREIMEEVVRDHGRGAAKDLLDEFAQEARDELEGAELSDVLEVIQEEVENLELEPEPPEDPCDEEFMEEISS